MATLSIQQWTRLADHSAHQPCLWSALWYVPRTSTPASNRRDSILFSMSASRLPSMPFTGLYRPRSPPPSAAALAALFETEGDSGGSDMEPPSCEPLGDFASEAPSSVKDSEDDVRLKRLDLFGEEGPMLPDFGKPVGSSMEVWGLCESRFGDWISAGMDMQSLAEASRSRPLMQKAPSETPPLKVVPGRARGNRAGSAPRMPLNRPVVPLSGSLRKCGHKVVSSLIACLRKCINSSASKVPPPSSSMALNAMTRFRSGASCVPTSRTLRKNRRISSGPRELLSAPPSMIPSSFA
mmetsp:Transcript_3009/g.8543  ORF Transcript_3009/g.8543 Transcript_3009/m.8543 type:complete len:295 (-) Transcript_3009:563-1447(-)